MRWSLPSGFDQPPPRAWCSGEEEGGEWGRAPVLVAARVDFLIQGPAGVPGFFWDADNGPPQSSRLFNKAFLAHLTDDFCASALGGAPFVPAACLCLPVPLFLVPSIPAACCKVHRAIMPLLLFLPGVYWRGGVARPTLCAPARAGESRPGGAGVVCMYSTAALPFLHPQKKPNVCSLRFDVPLPALE